MTDAYDLFQQGRSHLKEGMAAQATVALEKAKRLEPDKASIREALGIAYFRIQRWEEAEAEFRAVLELSPDGRLRALRARPGAREAGAGRRGERPLQARQLARTQQRALRRADPRARLNCRSRSRRRQRPGFDPGYGIAREPDGMLPWSWGAERLEASRSMDGPSSSGSRARPCGSTAPWRRRSAPACSCSSASRPGTSDDDADRLAGKIARLRIFENEDGRFDRSLLDTGGAALVVSQFTLLADTTKGNRPSFTAAAEPERGRGALRALLRRAARARRPGRDGRLRRADGGRARQRRAGHDRARRLVRLAACPS